jgi:predicted secreted acid phosphatase
MSKWDEWVQCEETADLVVWEEWVNYVEQGGVSLPKNEDRCCADSQRQDLTDLPF